MAETIWAMRINSINLRWYRVCSYRAAVSVTQIAAVLCLDVVER